MCSLKLCMHNFYKLCYYTVPANITTPPSDVTVVSPGNATLTCTADGVPAPNITWTRVVDGVLEELPEMSPDNTVMITSTPMDERTTVSTVSFFFTVTFFAAEYICRASNLLGTDAQAAVLTVHGEIILFVLEMFIFPH